MLAVVLSFPLLILAVQCVVMTMCGPRLVRGVAIIGGLTGSILNCMMLAGLMFERSFPCQVESPSPTSKFHKDRRSFEVKYYIIYVASEPELTLLSATVAKIS